MKFLLALFIFSSFSSLSFARPNPAATFCVDSLNGVYFPGESVCSVDQWDFFEAVKELGMEVRTKKPTNNIRRFGIGNPAAINCLNYKGTLSQESSESIDCLLPAWEILKEYKSQTRN